MCVYLLCYDGLADARSTKDIHRILLDFLQKYENILFPP